MLLPPRERESFYVYIDEFHELVSDLFSRLLTEARKFHFSLTLAHQHTSQLPPETLHSVLSAASSIIIFRVSAQDAARLEPEMAPIFRSRDMINLGPRQFYIKMNIGGNVYDPFSAEMLPLRPAKHASFRNNIMAFSKKYSISS